MQPPGDALRQREFAVRPYLRRYWFVFEEPSRPPRREAVPWAGGCGITAFSHEDALEILLSTFFHGIRPPTISMCVEDVDVSTLRDFVLLTIEPPIRRGVWFPRGFARP